MKTVLIASALAGLLATAALAQQPTVRDLAAAPVLKSPPANLLPTGIGGAVVYVRDLEAQRAWYQTMLGFKVQTTYSRGGKVFEHIMSTGAPGGAFMGLMQSDARPAGSNTNSRVVVQVPNPKALADYMATQGIYVREAVAGSAYFILDPEGNQVELYRLSTPAPAAK